MKFVRVAALARRARSATRRRRAVGLLLALGVLLSFGPAGSPALDAAEPGTWVSIGRENENIQAIGISRTNPSLIYAGVNEGRRGIFKTTDGGKTWLSFNNGLGELDIFALELDYRGDENVAIDDRVYAASGVSTPIWKTIDGGVTWRNRVAGSACGINQMIMDPINPLRIFISNCEGVIRTDDGGETTPWTTVGPAGILAPVIRISRADPSVVYFVKDQEIYRSSDGGVTTGLLPAIVGPEQQIGLRYIINDLIVDNFDANRLYVATHNAGIWKSEDGGNIWTPMNHTLPNQGQGLNFSRLAMDPQNGDVVWAYGTGLSISSVDPITAIDRGFFRTVDAGVTWQSIQADLPIDLVINDLIVPEHGDRGLMLTTFNGIWRYSPTAINDGDLVKSSQDPAEGGTVFLIENGSRRPITSFDTFQACGYATANIKLLPEWHLVSFADGAPLTSCSAPPGGVISAPAGTFGISNDGGIPMLNTYNALGGQASLGRAISRRFNSGPFVQQAFEGAILQFNPFSGGIERVNIFDQLSDRGLDAWLLAQWGVPLPDDWSGDAGQSWDAVVARHLRVLDANPLLGNTYLATAGWLDIYGLPMGYARAGGAGVLRAQRGVLVELNGVISTLNAGEVARSAGLIPAAALVSE
jgi:photosystem II stability/assembly factor-like uncharacterized protein